MVFSSIIFLCYFLPAFLLAYFFCPVRLKNYYIIAASLLFYAWAAPRFVFVILGTTFFDYLVVRALDRSADERKRKLLLCLSLFVNIGLLFYFKYCNFFIDQLNSVLQLFHARGVHWLSVVLPIGISFYTFETITYVVDVYRRVHAPVKKFSDYLLYIILFPKLIAGPIIRFHEFADQIREHHLNENAENRLRGLYRFFIGLAKKVLLANTIGAFADTIFALPVQEVGTFTAWMGALAYTFEIYFDFSGYSDMAIGLALIMGFRFPENFNNPYTATSITDFWRRWHITLGSWMKNYLYIPLGGNRVTSGRLYFNLFIVFLASGLWHGAAWGFIFWGAFHGFFLVLERLFLSGVLKKLGKWSVVYTFIVVTVGWVLFKLEHLGPAYAYLQRMFCVHADNGQLWYASREFWVIFGLTFFCSFFGLFNWGKRLQERFYVRNFNTAGHLGMFAAMLLLLVLIAGHITTSTFNPFIYFRF
jgi:alginate O-acetyltransferase complex protein AlgI